MSDKTTYCQRNGEKMLDRTKEYHENYEERLWKQARFKSRELSNEEKT